MTFSIQNRYLAHYLKQHPDDLKKMVFIAGPRQVGKTTLTESLPKLLGFKEALFLNWDKPADQRQLRDKNFSVFENLLANSSEKPLVVLDEIHKYPSWKNYLKGYFDTYKNKFSTIVTGSARLDIYRRGGDSLLGRYWLLHLYPLSIAELLKQSAEAMPEKFPKDVQDKSHKIFLSLLEWGGFPEPYFAASQNTHRRWVNMRRERLLQEDLRDLSKIHDIHQVGQLMDGIIQSVGSTLSVNSLRENLDKSYNAIKTGLKWLEQLYYCFSIPPYSKKILRALKKEAKYFLYDWSELKDPGARFENLVATHLKKAVTFWNDIGSGQFQLYYLRDLEKREVDFLITSENKPYFLIEAKQSIQQIPSSLIYYTQSLQPLHSILLSAEKLQGSYQVVKGHKIWVSGASSFFQNWV